MQLHKYHHLSCNVSSSKLVWKQHCSVKGWIQISLEIIGSGSRLVGCVSYHHKLLVNSGIAYNMAWECVTSDDIYHFFALFFNLNHFEKLQHTPFHLAESVENCVWDGVLHAAVTCMLCIVYLLLRGLYVMMPETNINDVQLHATYRLFHSHVQVETFIDSTRWTGV